LVEERLENAIEFFSDMMTEIKEMKGKRQDGLLSLTKIYMTP